MAAKLERVRGATTSSAGTVVRLSWDDEEVVAPDAVPVLEIVVRDSQELEAVSALLKVAMPALRESSERTYRMMDLLLPSRDKVPGPGAVAQARRNAELRAQLAHEFGLLTAADISENAGSRAKNQSATANRWRSEHRIFSVGLRGGIYYPGFQFDKDGRPRQSLASVLELLTPHLDGWELASWFTTPRSELDGKRPVDALDSDLEDVLQLARWLSDDRNERTRHASLSRA